MSSPRYKVRVFTSEDLHGLTGEKGERFCVLVRDTMQPVNSVWSWCATQERADHLAQILSSQAAED